MVIPKSDYGITLTIRSEAERISLLCEALHALCLYASGSSECAVAIQHAAVEAINNVVIHAYHNQPNHEITVRWSQEAKQIRVEIIDTGLSITCLPEPILPDFEAENSRGWWIINACVDEYFYQTFGENIAGPVLCPGDKPADATLLALKPHTNVLTLLKKF